MLLKGTCRARGAWIAAVAVLAFTGGQACEILEIFDENLACPALTPPGIRVVVVDAGSGEPVPRSANPTGFVVRGRVREPMSLVSVVTATGEVPTQFEGAHGPAGIYGVVIMAEGYELWRTGGISVQLDRCGHPSRTVEVTARLLPSTPTG